MSTQAIKADDVRLSDFIGLTGPCAIVRCPDCDGLVRVSLEDAGAWDTSCRCGVTWTVQLVATGTK